MIIDQYVGARNEIAYVRSQTKDIYKFHGIETIQPARTHLTFVFCLIIRVCMYIHTKIKYSCIEYRDSRCIPNVYTIHVTMQV